MIFVTGLLESIKVIVSSFCFKDLIDSIINVQWNQIDRKKWFWWHNNVNFQIKLKTKSSFFPVFHFWGFVKNVFVCGAIHFSDILVLNILNWQEKRKEKKKTKWDKNEFWCMLSVKSICLFSRLVLYSRHCLLDSPDNIISQIIYQF